VARFIVINGVGNNASVATGIREVADIFWWYAKCGQSYGPNYPLDVQRVVFANLLAFGAGEFFLAHELGHVETEFSAERLDYNEEIDANLRATRTIVKACTQNRTEVEKNCIRLHGINIAIVAFSALELFGVDFGGSHPPFSKRKMAIDSFISKNFDAEHLAHYDAEIARYCELVFLEIVHITQGITEHEGLYREEERRFAAEIRKKIEICASYPKGNPIRLQADHITFQAIWSDIVNTGYPYVIVDELQKLKNDYYTALARVCSVYNIQVEMLSNINLFNVIRREFGNMAYNDMQRDALAINRFRLVVHAIKTSLDEPAKSYFLKTLAPP
jgi:hypothetical protein